MFIAHMPAGYLLARLYGRLAARTETPGLVLAGVAGGALPDVDLVYGLLMDGGRVHHHLYWTHLPAFWFVVHASAIVLFRSAGKGLMASHRHRFTAFMLGIWSHLILDSVAGDIWWLWPWLNMPFSLVDIAPRYSLWWLNYLLHWTAWLEIAIVVLAAWMERTQPVLPRWRWWAA